MLGPATQRRRIGRPIRVLQRRRRLFPGTVLLYKAPPQCLTANQQAVLSVRERKQRQEGEGLSATGHRRKMTSAQLTAQSVSSLCSGTQSGINTSVAHRGFALRR